MALLPKILLGIYFLFLVAAGWRLFGIGWQRKAKIVTGLFLTVPVPLLFILPALLRTDGGMADLLLKFGLALLVCGALCLGGGFVAALLQARKR